MRLSLGPSHNLRTLRLSLKFFPRSADKPGTQPNELSPGGTCTDGSQPSRHHQDRRRRRPGGDPAARPHRPHRVGVPAPDQQDACDVHPAVPAPGGARPRRQRPVRRQRRRRAPQLPAVRDRPAVHRGLDPARLQDARLRLQRAHPRPHAADAARDAGNRAADQRPAAASARAVPEPADALGVHRRSVAAVDLHAPARLGVHAALRRVRLGRHLPRAGQVLLLPELPGGADPLVPRPRGAPHVAERLQRTRRDVHPPRRGGVAPRHPDRCPGVDVRAVRRAPGDPRRHVRQLGPAPVPGQRRVGRGR
jgi:hypothetical protein